MKTTKNAKRASRSAAPRCSAELYIQHERFCADRWKVMFRIGDETYSIGAECQLRDYAERLEHDFREALAKIGCILPNAEAQRPAVAGTLPPFVGGEDHA